MKNKIIETVHKKCSKFWPFFYAAFPKKSREEIDKILTTANHFELVVLLREAMRPFKPRKPLNEWRGRCREALEKAGIKDE